MEFYFWYYSCWLFNFLPCWLYQRSLKPILILGCDWKLSVGFIQTRHMYLLPIKVCGRLWWGWRLCGFTFHHQLIDWLQVNNPKFLLLIVLHFLSSGRIMALHIHWSINITDTSSFFESLIKVWFTHHSCWKKVCQVLVVKVWRFYPAV